MSHNAVTYAECSQKMCVCESLRHQLGHGGTFGMWSEVGRLRAREPEGRALALKMMAGCYPPPESFASWPWILGHSSALPHTLKWEATAERGFFSFLTVSSFSGCLWIPKCLPCFTTAHSLRKSRLSLLPVCPSQSVPFLLRILVSRCHKTSSDDRRVDVQTISLYIGYFCDPKISF